jgi:pimeloyl-ACP methyl ester carboxylesterase
MAFAVTSDGLKLYFEEVGQGVPILFVHEFAGDHRSWEPQLRADTNRPTFRAIRRPTATCTS